MVDTGQSLERTDEQAGQLDGRGLLSAEQWTSVADSLGLSERERQIVQALFDDLHESQIAEHLQISTHTVHTHLERLRRKLRVHSRSGVVVRVFAEHFALQGRPDPGP